jgi:hypothetical protein
VGDEWFKGSAALLLRSSRFKIFDACTGLCDGRSDVGQRKQIGEMNMGERRLVMTCMLLACKKQISCSRGRPEGVQQRVLHVTF